MKLIIQLFFFGIALLLTFIGIATWFILWADATPQGLAGLTPIDNYTEEDSMMAAVGALFFPIISILIYFALWKTNFFTRNKQS